MDSLVLLLSLTLAALPLAQAETVLGAYIFHRHGDRTPKSHAPANLTSLGAEQCFKSGDFYRQRYVASGSSSPMFSLSRDLAVPGQLSVTAPSDTVLQSSAQVFLQGLYPPVGDLSSEKLANGTDFEAPLNGYQYIPVSAVATASSSAGAEDSEWLQGGSGCGNAVISSNNYLSTSEYRQTLDDTRSFYEGLLPVINGTFEADEANFKNAYTIFDLINVARIHNATIPSSDLLTPETVTELQTLANIHEWNLAYNSSEPIRAVAGSVLAGQVLQQLNSTLTGRSKKPFGIQFGAYASFASLFGLARLQDASPDFTGIVDYASSIAFELVTNASVTASSYPEPSDVSVRFLFANGTAANNPLTAYPLFGREETVLPWSTFADEMAKIAISNTQQWCTACGNTTGTCDPAALGTAGAQGAGSGSDAGGGDDGISRPVAGVIGALVTLVVVLGLEALVYFLAGLKLVKKSTLAAAGATSAAAAAAAQSKA